MAISAHHIVLFWFNNDWGRYGRAYERVAEHLATMPEVEQVVCMFPPVSSAERDGSAALRVRQVAPRLTLLEEILFGERCEGGWLSRIRYWYRQLRRDRALRQRLRLLGFRAENTILWLFPPHPYIERLLTAVPRCGVVTHVIDDFTKFDPGHELHGYALAQYPKLGQWSDFIITTSEANFDRFSRTGRPCGMFWPAVDDSFIGVPEDLPHRLHGTAPRLGYVGWIMERTDLDLVRFIAVQQPNWKLILVGPEYPEGIVVRSGITSLANVEYRGEIAQKNVPAFLRSLDVCLMPHRDNEYSRSMGPLKLYQYLASGRPVVTTEVAGLDKIREHIRVADSYHAFVQNIEEVLRSDNLEMAARRIEKARGETWSVRVREMYETALNHINTDHRPGSGTFQGESE